MFRTFYPKNGPFLGSFWSHTSQKFSTQSSTHFDVAVIGGGPGGYVAAIKAAQLGLKAACIEQRGTLGGTCLNVGCIPSKALLNMTHKYYELKNVYGKYGIRVGEVGLDLGVMMCEKSRVVGGLTSGVELLFRKNGVEYIKGKGRIINEKCVMVDNTHKYTAENIIIATGSTHSEMTKNVLKIDENVIISSNSAIKLKNVPTHLTIVGAGVIGVEMASVWARLGTQTHIIEFLPRICNPMDLDGAKSLQKSLEKQGIKFHLSNKVTGADVRENGATVYYEPVKGGTPQKMDTDVVLVAVGRVPYTEGLGLEEMGIEMDKGKVVVDENFTVPNFPSIKAIGDVIRGPMLAHKAEEEGIAVAEMIANTGAAHVDYNTIPNIVYTHPEFAGVGASEEELKANGVDYKKGTFSFAANSRAKANDDTDGMVKILVEKKTDKILGGWIVGANAGELVSELTLALAYGGSSEDIGRTCHGHPTLSEAVKEACMATYDKPIHS